MLTPPPPILQEMAQRALTNYLRSVWLQPNKAVFDVTALPVGEYALSLGLPTAPELRFLKKESHRKKAKERALLEGSAAERGSDPSEAAAAASDGDESDGDGAAADRGGPERAERGLVPERAQVRFVSRDLAVDGLALVLFSAAKLAVDYPHFWLDLHGQVSPEKEETSRNGDGDQLTPLLGQGQIMSG